MDMGLSWWDCCVSKNPTILLIIISNTLGADSFGPIRGEFELSRSKGT